MICEIIIIVDGLAEKQTNCDNTIQCRSVQNYDCYGNGDYYKNSHFNFRYIYIWTLHAYAVSVPSMYDTAKRGG